MKTRETSPNRPVIAICHLNWDWVWQRPQQFLSRLSKTHPVLFVQTHCSETENGFTHTQRDPNHPGVTILDVHLPRHRWHDGDFIDNLRREILQDRLENEFEGRYDRSILWFYDPMAVTAYAGHLGEKMIVYDCMDELSQFRGAPPALAAREKELTQQADLIFCGGRKMRDKRLPLNPNTHFYGTGVDCAHFGKARTTALPLDPQIAALSGPVLGYFGVIDERIDYELLARLAEAGEWSIAMVGPYAKVSPDSFPRHSHLHWLGGRQYQDLPAIVKGFDVCIMPFALNASTEYINPTKVLEYMAAAKPIVSTALDEVRTNFRKIPRVAANHDEFITLCQKEIQSPSRIRLRRGLNLAAENTWDAIVEKMEGHIADFLAPKTPAAPQGARRASLLKAAQLRPQYV